ncbi:DNA endonuclease SmrA [Alkalimonas delamerensis]|uniref:DNA endonuclease SmrA n=1 Tax=Alkalimonas delamerensis TaxID=265981 RepID=A0ABT9GRY3_9GAMM|nr:DNA endonuclease SmrA [Alkalimonas delamerensis]MDP4529740.1 DNA endonuclease SmrA [Alkalimonas delamerensis]
MSSDELNDFLKEMADVRPLTHNEIAPETGDFQPSLAQLARREAAEQAMEFDPNYLSTEYVDLLKPDDLIDYKKDGVQEGVYRNLRLGKYQLDATLNLLGKNLQEARKQLFDFIQDCHQRGIRTLLIHHGTGRNSKPHPAILKSYCAKWISQIPAVLACHTAQRHHGGYAASYVLLQKNQQQKRDNRERHSKRL